MNSNVWKTMKHRQAKRRLRRGLAAASPHDFDGHTAFAQMTPEQRLRWLDEVREFIITYRGAAAQHPPSHHATPTDNKSTN